MIHIDGGWSLEFPLESGSSQGLFLTIIPSGMLFRDTFINLKYAKLLCDDVHCKYRHGDHVCFTGSTTLSSRFYTIHMIS